MAHEKSGPAESGGAAAAVGDADLGSGGCRGKDLRHFSALERGCQGQDRNSSDKNRRDQNRVNQNQGGICPGGNGTGGLCCGIAGTGGICHDRVLLVGVIEDYNTGAGECQGGGGEKMYVWMVCARGVDLRLWGLGRVHKRGKLKVERGKMGATL